MNRLEKAIMNQASPERSIKKIISLDYKTICEHITTEISQCEYNDRGEIEYIDGEYCLSMDFEIVQGRVEYSCVLLTHEGNEIKSPWSSYDFDLDCKYPDLGVLYNDYEDGINELR